MSQFGLLKSRRFWPLFWTQFLGAFNDNFLKNALVILITFKSVHVLGVSPGQMVALSGGIFILPFFLFSATSGQLADQLEKSKLIHWIKLMEIGIMILAAIGFVSEHYAFLMLVLFLMGLHSTFFGPIKYSILPQHLEPHELIGANALIEAGTFLSILLGTIAGGTLILAHQGIMWTCTGLIAIAVVGYVASLFVPKAPPVASSIQVEWNPVPPTLKILKATYSDKTLFYSIIGISWFWFYGATLLAQNESTHQAFRLQNRAWGLQFHIEVTAETLAEWADAAPDTIEEFGGRERFDKTVETFIGQSTAAAKELAERFMVVALNGFNHFFWSTLVVWRHSGGTSFGIKTLLPIYDKTLSTTSFTSVPSALPLRSRIRAPMTLFASAFVLAPSSAALACTAAVTSSRLICAGR